MKVNRRKNKLFIRLLFWLIYLFSGYILYAKSTSNYLIDFSRYVYPLTIFWLQIRINKKEKWIPIDSSMSTSQLWFRIIPVLGSVVTFITTIINTIDFIINLFY